MAAAKRSATLAALAEASIDNLAVISFKDSQAGVEQFALRDDHLVEPWRQFIATENLSNQSFGPVPADGASQFPGGCDAEPPHGKRVRQ
jgi:hypothetical protein